MQLEARQLARIVSGKVGFDLEADTGMDSEGQRWYTLRPSGESAARTFTIRTALEWRRLRVTFELGDFAGAFLSSIGDVDEVGRAAFCAILDDCRKHGAKIDMRVNDQRCEFDQDEVWAWNWSSFIFSLNKGNLELGSGDSESDAEIICFWTCRFAAAIFAIIPIERESDVLEHGFDGYPEGAFMTIRTNRYERDPRNRAVAILIHGASCQGCGLDMGERYGQVAAGYIEVHHMIPVSKLGPDYVIDPARDLIPLCPNCHAVAHRRSPPFSLSEIKTFLKSQS